MASKKFSDLTKAQMEAAFKAVRGSAAGDNPSTLITDSGMLGTEIVSVFSAAGAAQHITSDSLATWINAQTAVAVDIDGGAIDGTVIGANSAAAGTFTQVSVDDYVRHTGDANTYMGFPADDQVALVAGGVQAILATATAVTILGTVGITGNTTVTGNLTATGVAQADEFLSQGALGNNPRYRLNDGTQSWSMRGNESTGSWELRDITNTTTRLSVTNAGLVTVPGTLGVTGAATFSSTVGVTGNLTVNTDKFSVNAGSGSIDFGASAVLKLGASSYFRAGATQGFLVNNSADTLNLLRLTDAGNLSILQGNLTVGTLTLASGSITDSSGAISFGNENLSTTGTLASGAPTFSGIAAISSPTTRTLSLFYTGSGDSVWQSFYYGGSTERWRFVNRSSGQTLAIQSVTAGLDILTLTGTGATIVGTLASGAASVNGNLVVAGDTPSLTNSTGASLITKATTGEVFRADAAAGAFRIVADQTGVNTQGVLTHTGNATVSGTLDVTSDVTLSAGDLDLSGAGNIHDATALYLGSATTSNNAQFFATKTYSNASGNDIAHNFTVNQDTATTGNIRGLYEFIRTSHGSGTVAGIRAVTGYAYVGGAGNVTTATALYAKVDNANASATIGTAYGLYIDSFSATGTITNRWGIYQAGSSEKNHMAGALLIGTTTQSASELLRVNGDVYIDDMLTVNGSVVMMANLPTSDPLNAGQLWNSSGTVTVSAG